MRSLIIVFLLSPELLAATNIAEAVAKLEEVNAMREGLAGTLSGSQVIGEEDFKRVCAPVGQELKRWAQTTKASVRQLSDRFRNPAHKAEGADLSAIQELRSQPSRLYFIEKRKVGGEDGIQIYRRIDVRAACLRCHGPADKLPSFIKEKYPADLANGFAEGDLRGSYSVWVKSGP